MVLRSRLLQTSFVAVSALVGVGNAFPTAKNFAKLLRPNNVLPAAQGQQPASVDNIQDLHRELVRLREKRLLVDLSSDPIDISGDHAFQAPDLDNGDQRGPCPGLNALANHNYIPRNGVVGFLDLVDAINSVYGMGIELATILAVMGTVGVGNPLSLTPGFSIGGQPPGDSLYASNILGNLLGLTETPRGLQGSHNWIEGDSSNTRDDLYVTGDAWTMNMTLFLDAYNSVEGDVITMEDMGARAAQRFEESIGINPYFYYGPYTGLVARNAGYAFAGRLLSNHSAEYPGGQLTKDVFKSFFGVVEENGALVYKQGQERIPDNWYRIPVDYGLVGLNADLVAWVLQHPVLGSIGGNMGEVNTFAGLNMADITGGVLNATSLLEGNNLFCFVMEIVKTFAPNALAGLFKTLETPLELLNDAILDPLLDLSCPAFEDMTAGGTDLFSYLTATYPGANRTGLGL